MYLHPQYPSQEDILIARDRMLQKHSNLRYEGCHLGSMEWSVDKQAKWLDRFQIMDLIWLNGLFILRFRTEMDLHQNLEFKNPHKCLTEKKNEKQKNHIF